MAGGGQPTSLLTEQQRLDWLRLIRTEGVGPRSFFGLINRYGSATAALAALPELARAAGRKVTLADEERIAREWELCRRHGVALVARGEAGYPARLATLHDAPPLIGVRGNRSVLDRPMLAIVGARNASALGLTFTERLACDLGKAGFVVVSGLARGVDAAAHRASLTSGTVAVLAGGHGRVYPEQNLPLLDEILGHGAAVSEMPFELEPRARDFPRRNRLVAGLSLGVVVVEAARRSGSLITARLANEQGREVFAVPGSPLDPRAEGTNDLLRQGATLCTGAADVLAALEPILDRGERQGTLFEDTAAGRPDGREEWEDDADWLIEGLAADGQGADEAAGSVPLPRSQPMPHSSDPFAPPAASDETTDLLALLGASPVSIDDLVRVSGLAAREVRRQLLEAEIDGKVRSEGAAGYVRLTL